MNFQMDELLKQDPYAFDAKEKRVGGHFYTALIEELCYHYDQNPLYRKFSQNKGFNPHKFSGEISEIPPVQVSVFKELGKHLSSVPSKDIRFTLQSSATSGIPSSIPVDRTTAKRQARAMVRVISSFLGNERRPFLIMDIDPRAGYRELLGARFAAVSGYLNFASRAGYFLKVNEARRYYFDTDAMQAYIDSLEDEPAVVFGFTFLLFSEVVQPLERRKFQFSLPKGSKVIHIGGWKKLEEQKIEKSEFNARLAHLFGIEETDIMDIYGFTEQMGLNYPDCACGAKHASLYSEVLVRDVKTKKVLPPGEIGLLEFVSPLPHSYPGNVVLTDDLGVIESDTCNQGRCGTRFRVVGRLKKAEVRGCGDILSSKLKFADASETAVTKEEGFHIEFFAGRNLQDASPESALEIIRESLHEKQTWLRAQPVDALIGLIGKAAEKWAEGDGGTFRYLATRGLGFLAAWCRPEHLTAMMNAGLRGKRTHMDGFLPNDDQNLQSIMAVPRGLACHWLAGNVQVLGMFVLVLSILTKNANVLKVSSHDQGVFRQLLEAFRGTTFRTHSGYEIAGDDLLETISVIYFPHDDHATGMAFSRMADVRIAWGGAEAVQSVAALPAKYGVSDIFMGPKLSFAVVAREMLADEHMARKLARRISVDASVFDQAGCASAHNVFVERGGAVSPELFAKLVASAMEKTAQQIPSEGMTSEQMAAVHSARGIYDFKGIVYGDSDARWTVLYSDDAELHAPVYSRVLFLHPVDDICEAVPFVTEDIQTIGLAAAGRKAETFARKAAVRGAVRFPACGRMLDFDVPWDGMNLPERMVKWITLGGPYV